MQSKAVFETSTLKDRLAPLLVFVDGKMKARERYVSLVFEKNAVLFIASTKLIQCMCRVPLVEETTLTGQFVLDLNSFFDIIRFGGTTVSLVKKGDFFVLEILSGEVVLENTNLSSIEVKTTLYRPDNDSEPIDKDLFKSFLQKSNSYLSANKKQIGRVRVKEYTGSSDLGYCRAYFYDCGIRDIYLRDIDLKFLEKISKLGVFFINYKKLEDGHYFQFLLESDVDENVVEPFSFRVFLAEGKQNGDDFSRTQKEEVGNVVVDLQNFIKIISLIKKNGGDLKSIAFVSKKNDNNIYIVKSNKLQTGKKFNFFFPGFVRDDSFIEEIEIQSSVDYVEAILKVFKEVDSVELRFFKDRSFSISGDRTEIRFSSLM